MGPRNIRVMVEQLLDKAISPMMERQYVNMRELLRAEVGWFKSGFSGRKLVIVGRIIRSFSSTLVAGYCVGTTLFNMVGYPAQVNGKSMQPSLNFPASPARTGFLGYDLNSDWVFVNCWRAKKFEVTRGEVVVLVSPKDPTDNVIKRVVALEGDTVRPHSAFYQRNLDDQSKVKIPSGHCWVEGDNWTNSVDSNKYGPVPLGLVFGVATHIVWPPHRWQEMEVRPMDQERLQVSGEGGRTRR